jgi:vancomycin resistance protein YoaR
MNRNDKKQTSIVILVVLVTLILSFIISIPDKNNLSKSKKELETDEPFFLKVVRPEVSLEGLNIGGLNVNQINRLLRKLSQKKSIEPQNAFIFRDKIFDSKLGRSIDIKKTMKNILSAKTEDKIRCSYTTIVPTINKEMFKSKGIFYFTKIDKSKSKSRILGHYTTYLANNSLNRRNNIKIALEDINYYELKPKEEFSFNQIIGLPSQEKGYKKAPIIDSGKFIPKVGGGICQVSTTLYNATLEAKLKITERHRHSKALSYIKAGQDATVVPQEKDFKFVNNTKNPLIILTDIIDRYVAIYILEEIRD